MLNKYSEREWDWYRISCNPNIIIQDIINHPEYPWNWDKVFESEFKLDKELYVTNQIGRVLLVSMLDEYTNDTNTIQEPCQLDHTTIMILCNDYHISRILSYI